MARQPENLCHLIDCTFEIITFGWCNRFEMTISAFFVYFLQFFQIPRSIKTAAIHREDTEIATFSKNLRKEIKLIVTKGQTLGPCQILALEDFISRPARCPMGAFKSASLRQINKHFFSNLKYLLKLVIRVMKY